MYHLVVEFPERVVFIFHHPDLTWKVAKDDNSLKGEIGFHRYAAETVGKVLPKNRVFYLATNTKLCRLLSENAGAIIRHREAARLSGCWPE